MNDLQREIFGGSDDEDLSEEDDIQVRRPLAAAQPQPSGAVSESEGDDEADREVDEDYDNEANKPEDGPKKSLKPLKVPKKKQTQPAGEEDAIPERRRRKRNKTAPDAPEDAVPVEVELTGEELRKHKLAQAIDAAARSGRSVRPKKRKKGDEDILDAAADEEVNRIKISMELAVLEDQESIRKGKPALAKIKMLQEVTDVLQKQSLMQSIIDQNLLDLVRQWLEPSQDKSLPALNIQRAIFEILGKMFIETSALKESGLGKIVLFYTKKNKRVSPAIKNQADNLVAAWSRPILKRSASYRDRTLTVADIQSQDPSGAPGVKKTGIKLSAILAQGRAEDANRPRRNAVRIPERNMAAFTVVPRSTVQSGGAAGQQAALDMERRRAAQERLRRVQRKLEINKQRSSRM